MNMGSMRQDTLLSTPDAGHIMPSKHCGLSTPRLMSIPAVAYCTKKLESIAALALLPTPTRRAVLE